MPSKHTLTWDGTTASGTKTSNGIYVINIQGTGFLQQRSVFLLQ